MRTTTKQIRETPIHLDDETIQGIKANVLELLPTLLYHQFQQIAAVFSPRPNMPDSDSIPFTRTTAEETHQALMDSGIKSIITAYSENGGTHYSVVFAKTDKGIEKAENQARKIARKNRARLDIFK